MEPQQTIKKPYLYIAGPLFSEPEKEFNAKLKNGLSPFFNVYLPQEDGGLLVDMVREGCPPGIAARKVFKIDIDALNNCDAILVILDGRTIDEGASFELGYAYAKEKDCFGLKTDPRQLLATGNNPMIDCPLKQIFANIDDVVTWAEEYSALYTMNIEETKPELAIVNERLVTDHKVSITTSPTNNI